jgi:hypothetical protein
MPEAILMCRVGGMLGPDTRVELTVVALDSALPDCLQLQVDEGIERVKREYPEAQDVRLLEDWHEAELVPVEEAEIND